MSDKGHKPNCYDCKHRRGLTGDAHSRCAHPTNGEYSDPLTEIMGLFANVGRVAPLPNFAASPLNIKCNPTGWARGWFNWPVNYDPVWLESCSGFTRKEVAHESTMDSPSLRGEKQVPKREESGHNLATTTTSK